jgi:hypothetical protein
MLARMLAIGTALIFVAAAAPAAYSGDTGGIKGKTAVKSAPQMRKAGGDPNSTGKRFVGTARRAR